jgi:hypothetical protein
VRWNRGVHKGGHARKGEDSNATRRVLDVELKTGSWRVPDELAQLRDMWGGDANVVRLTAEGSGAFPAQASAAATTKALALLRGRQSAVLSAAAPAATSSGARLEVGPGVLDPSATAAGSARGERNGVGQRLLQTLRTGLNRNAALLPSIDTGYVCNLKLSTHTHTHTHTHCHFGFRVHTCCVVVCFRKTTG